MHSRAHTCEPCTKYKGNAGQKDNSEMEIEQGGATE